MSTIKVTLIDDRRLDDMTYSEFVVEMLRYKTMLTEIFNDHDTACIDVCVVTIDSDIKTFFHFKLYKQFLSNMERYATKQFSELLQPFHILFDSMLHYGIIHRDDGPYSYSIPCNNNVSFAINGRYCSMDTFAKHTTLSDEELFLLKIMYGGLDEDPTS